MKKNKEISFWDSIFNEYFSKDLAERDMTGILEFWNKRADKFAGMLKEINSPYTNSIKDFLKEEFKIGEQTSVLDIGAGTGIISASLCDEVKDCMAVDVSPNMLKHLDDFTRDKKINNITTLCSRWMDVDDTMGCYDIVICHRAFGVSSTDSEDYPDFYRSVKKMNDMAKRGVVIISPAKDSLKQELKEIHSPRDNFEPLDKCDHLYNLCYAMRYFPQVKYILRNEELVYYKFDEFYESLQHGKRSKITKKQAMEYFANKARKQGEKYIIDNTKRTKILWWIK